MARENIKYGRICSSLESCFPCHRSKSTQEGFAMSSSQYRQNIIFSLLSASLLPPVKVPEIQSKQVRGSFHIKLSAYFKLGVGGEDRDNNRQSDISVCALRTCHESSRAEEGSQTMTRSKRSVGWFNDWGFMWFLWVDGCGERELL